MAMIDRATMFSTRVKPEAEGAAARGVLFCGIFMLSFLLFFFVLSMSFFISHLAAIVVSRFSHSNNRGRARTFCRCNARMTSREFPGKCEQEQPPELKTQGL